MRVLIAGCGDVGSALGLMLAASGHVAFGLRRRAGRLPEGIQGVGADLAVPSSLNALPEGLDAVVYSAAADGYSDEAYRAAYVDGVRNLLEALARGQQRPARFVFVSSTGVYGQSEGEWVDEASVTEPAAFSGRRLLEGERLARAQGPGGSVVRLGGIYGPGRRRLVDRVRRGEACREGLWTNRIHRDDAAAVLAHLLVLADPAPVYLGVDCEPAAECTVMDWLAERLGVPRPARATGAPARRANKRCRNERLLASGYRFRYPTFREGYAQVLPDTG